jgi:hypothetical protein
MARTYHTFLCWDNANWAWSIPHAIDWAETFDRDRLVPFSGSMRRNVPKTLER